MNNLPDGLENLITDKDQKIKFISAMLELIKRIADEEIILIGSSGENKLYTDKERNIDEYMFCSRTFRYIYKRDKQ